jgi:hypothetical protein
VLEPLDFMARLAALVPPPRIHLTRDHAVFAPHSRLRAAAAISRSSPASKSRGIIARILAHLEPMAPERYPPELPLGARAPPGR